MKHFILLLFLGLTSSGFSQYLDTVIAKKFWSDNIQNIVHFDKQKILAQTHFPIKVGEKILTAKQFELSINQLFQPELRDELSHMDINEIDAWVMYEDPTPTYMIVCNKGVGDHESVLFSFFQYDGNWMLQGMTYFEEEKVIYDEED